MLLLVIDSSLQIKAAVSFAKGFNVRPFYSARLVLCSNHYLLNEYYSDVFLHGHAFLPLQSRKRRL